MKNAAGEVINHVTTGFDSHKIIHDLRHYLPTQSPIKDFIHHNSLHAYQDKKFFDAIFSASKTFGFRVTFQLKDYRKMFQIGRIKPIILDRIVKERKGENTLATWKEKLINGSYDEHQTPLIGQLRSNWKTQYHTDLDNLVQPILFRILSAYLDQGISVMTFPHENEGFLASIRNLEKNSNSSFFRTKEAQKRLLSGDCTLAGLLKDLVGEEAFFDQYIFDQQFGHRGWSGMVATLEDRPDTLLDGRPITLEELLVFELLLEIDALDATLGEGRWKPLCQNTKENPIDLFAELPKTELHEVLSLWQLAFEWSYYDEVLAGMAQHRKRLVNNNETQKTADTGHSFQAIFCIDERECSIRRHIEQVDPHCQTLGMPGFFGVEFYFRSHGAKFIDKLAPAPVTPKFLINEITAPHDHNHPHDRFYTNQSHTLLGGLVASFTLGFWSAGRLIQNLFAPKMSPAISDAFAHTNVKSTLTIENKSTDAIENGLQVGFTIPEMATRVENALRGIGLIKNFAPIVYLMGHGSSSANNPHHGAHDCGACSGRPGSVNSRVLAFMANHPKVRAILAEKGIHIPEDTQFLGALHDTAADRIQYYDAENLNAINTQLHLKNIESFERALDRNAKERSRRFSSIATKDDIHKVRKEILDRSVSLFEPRPELGHGTNALCIIGNRDMTKGLFLDRRAFLNSYDYRTDPEGKILTGLMGPIGPVCGGINLEYYFSRMDNYKLGAGTKLPHNVVGLIGVSNSSDGDLRPGLPLQMIEVHDPVRLLVVVEHSPEVLLKVIQSNPAMYEWYNNEWVHIVAIDPTSGDFYYHDKGAFHLYSPSTEKVAMLPDVLDLVEKAKEMKTNHIVHATMENLPVYVLEH
jgi:uncharacterized protein